MTNSTRVKARGATTATWRGNFLQAVDHFTKNGAAVDPRITGKARQVADAMTRKEVGAPVFDKWLRSEGGENRVAWCLAANGRT